MLFLILPFVFLMRQIGGEVFGGVVMFLFVCLLLLNIPIIDYVKLL